MEYILPPFGKIEPKFDEDNADDAEKDIIAAKETEASIVNAPISVSEAQLNNEIESDKAEFANEEIHTVKRINKKRAFTLLLITTIIVAGAVFSKDIYSLLSGTVASKADEVADIAKTNVAAPTKFIDDDEKTSSYLKENTDAKQANVNVFDFDINNCLQKYSDEQCTDMYEKSLLVNDKR